MTAKKALLRLTASLICVSLIPVVPVFADYVVTDRTGIPISFHTTREDHEGSEAENGQSGISNTGSGKDDMGEWVMDDHGWRFRFKNGDEVTGDWYLYEDNWYYFGQDGYMVTGLQTVNGILYYFDETIGYMVHDTTVTLPGGPSYTFRSDGSCEWPYKPIIEIPPDSEKDDNFRLLDSMCDEILAGIVRPEMSDREKCRQIYAWIRNNLKYINNESGTDWVSEAIQGIRSGRGECFTYFAVATALLTRCGMECIQVVRSTDNNHYWVLVHTSDGWYHFDATPRSSVDEWVCLVTDAGLKKLPKASSWIFDETLYPRTP